MLRRRRPAEEEDLAPPARRRNTPPPPPHRFYHASESSDARCAVCQFEFEAGQELYVGPCNHPLHAPCAGDYVREWRLNHEEACPTPCATCKCTSAFDDALFAADDPEEEAQEQQRRLEAAKREQEDADSVLARELYFQEFGGIVVRRGVLRRADLEIYAFIARAVNTAEGA